MKYGFYFLVTFFIFSCQRGEVSNYKEYLNHNDTVKYVGMNECKICHLEIYNSFTQTGMGKSLSPAVKINSSLANKPNLIYDTIKNLFYQPVWINDSLWIKEFRIYKKDTVHILEKKVNYIIGSGHHTNSHLFEVNGFLHQMPYTYYTQDSISDLPPGYENGNNTRFTREINMECMTCHNAYPSHVEGSNNKFTHIPNGIDCERCHGPGEIHVKQKSLGIIIDTSKYIDYSIVNPGKLTKDLQFDVCQRCHLQGTAILHKGFDYTDFKPGEHLNEVMDVYLPKYKNDNSFIMASHVERLKQSKCFNNSEMTCVSCHNPHENIQNIDKQFFDKKCMECHNVCNEEENVNNCFSCHMPKSSSIDIPHVSITDHNIAVPSNKPNINKQEKEFLGLFAINNNYPSNISKAKAYLKRFESFEKNLIYLDSAYYYLEKTDVNNYPFYIQYYYLRNDLYSLINYHLSIDTLVYDDFKDDVVSLAFSRVAESFSKNGMITNAKVFYNKAIFKSPYVLDYKIKLVSLFINNEDYLMAENLLNELIYLNPSRKEVYLNLGFLNLKKDKFDLAEINFLIALELDPDYVLAFENLALLSLKSKKVFKAKSYLLKILEIAPDHLKANNLINQLN